MRSAALVACTLLLSSAIAGAGEVAVGTEAPAIEGKKWFTATGAAPEYKGKVYVVEFWFASWGPCNASVPHLKESAKKYAEKGVVVVAPSLDAEGVVKGFKEKHKIEEYALLSDARKSAKAWGVSGFPTAFVVGKDGKVAWSGHPMSGLDKAIEAALAAK